MLPKAALADIGSPAELLADGVEVLSSVWSPLLCSSVSRIRGPGGVAPAAWVPELPEGGSLVTDDRYYTGSTAAKPAPEPGGPTAESEPSPAMPASRVGADPYRPLQYALDELGIDASRVVTRGAGTRIAVLDSTPGGKLGP